MSVKARKAVAALVAAITSPEFIKAERNAAVFVATRVLLAVGASTAVIELVAKVVGG